MFFMMGIMPGKKVFDFNQTVICDVCGKYGRYQVYMTYMVLSIFFIPVFKWGRQYYVKMTCCDSVYYLDPEVGRRIARGEQVEIMPEDIELANKHTKVCRDCGYSTEEDFDYCPKCGKKL